MPISSRPDTSRSWRRKTRTGTTSESVRPAHAASLARKIYLRPQIGVGRLRHIYGGKKNYGSANEHHAQAAGKIIREGLKELERVGIVMRYNDKRNNLVEQPEGDAKFFARVISPDGAKELNNIAKEVFDGLLKAK